MKAAQGRGWTISGAELSRFAADHASRELGVPMFHGDFRDMGFEPDTLDAITFIHVIEHLRAPMDFLRESAVLLKPGGVLMFDVPNVTAWEFKVARLLRQMWRGFIIEHLYYFTPAFITRALNDLGLERVAMSGWSPATRLPNPLNDIRQMWSARSAAQEPAASAGSSASDSPTVPPLEPVSLVRRILRQANNYMLDTVASLSERQHGTPANMFYVWARKVEPTAKP